VFVEGVFKLIKCFYPYSITFWSSFQNGVVASVQSAAALGCPGGFWRGSAALWRDPCPAELLPSVINYFCKGHDTAGVVNSLSVRSRGAALAFLQGV
jgi:hypothetical protein